MISRFLLNFALPIALSSIGCEVYKKVQIFQEINYLDGLGTFGAKKIASEKIGVGLSAFRSKFSWLFFVSIIPMMGFCSILCFIYLAFLSFREEPRF